MATIAAYTSPAPGHVLPLAGVLLELQSRGHRIRLRTSRREVRRMRGLGFDADAVDPEIEGIELDDWRARPLRQALRSMIGLFSARAALETVDAQALLDGAAPDLIVTDINTWGAAAVAERSGLPWVAFSPYSPFVRSEGLPPYGPGLRPASGPLAATRDAVFSRLVLEPLEREATERRNELRARVGLPPLATNDAHVRRAPLTLVATAEPLEYRHRDWAPDLRLVGETSWEPRAPTPPWLRDVTGPLVLVTTSMDFQRDSAIVRTAFEALEHEPVTVVATMPAGIQRGIRVPRNGRLVEHAPHGQLLDRAVCAITHGGLGVTQKALARRVPVVVVPWGRDQFEVAARVEHAGAGVRVHRRRLSAVTLREAVARARELRAGVDAVADGLAAAGGAAAAASLVEEHLRDSVRR